jgi:hypothetical protein
MLTNYSQASMTPAATAHRQKMSHSAGQDACKLLMHLRWCFA